MDDNYDEASVPLELETKENLLSLLEKKDDDLRVAGEIGRQLLEKNQMLERLVSYLSHSCSHLSG